MFQAFLLGPAEHFPVVVYFILVNLIIAIVVVAVGRARAVVTAKQVVAVTDADVVAELVEDGIKALAFTLLKRSTLGHQAH